MPHLPAQGRLSTPSDAGGRCALRRRLPSHCVVFATAADLEHVGTALVASCEQARSVDCSSLLTIEIAGVVVKT